MRTWVRVRGAATVQTFGTGKLDENRLEELVRANFKLTPKGIIDHLQLRRQSAHGMRRRLQINREQDGKLARREIRLAIGDEREGEILQQLQGLRRPQFHGHDGTGSFPELFQRTAEVSTAIPLAQQGIERTRHLAFAAVRARGLRARRPGIDVEMRPGLGGGDEAVEEQRGRDRSGEAAAHIVDVGDL